MNTIQKLVARTLLASIPLMSVGCSNQSQFGENISLDKLRDVLPSGEVFDENHDGALSAVELQRYFSVTFEKKKDDIFTQGEIDKMRTIARYLDSYVVSWKSRGERYEPILPKNVALTVKELKGFIQVHQRVLWNKQDTELRDKKYKMFPSLKDNENWER